VLLFESQLTHRIHYDANSHDELWNLVDIVAKDHLGCYEEFKHGISQAIMLARTKDANSVSQIRTASHHMAMVTMTDTVNEL
jgi:hypothetical protein